MDEEKLEKVSKIPLKTVDDKEHGSDNQLPLDLSIECIRQPYHITRGNDRIEVRVDLETLIGIKMRYRNESRISLHY